MCNANMEFTNVVARWPGSTHDMTIFNNSILRANFENGDYPNCIILGKFQFLICVKIHCICFQVMVAMV